MNKLNNLESTDETYSDSVFETIRSLTRMTPVLAMILAMTACSKKEVDPAMQEQLQACKIKSAEIEGILAGLNIDFAKNEPDAQEFGDSDQGRLMACGVNRARLRGLLKGTEIERTMEKGSIAVIESPGDRVRREAADEARERDLQRARDVSDSLSDPWEQAAKAAQEAAAAPVPSVTPEEVEEDHATIFKRNRAKLR